MKKFKKILALGLSLAMVLGMGVTSFAANEDGKRDKDDTATVTISGLEKTAEGQYPTVALYQIAKGNYTTDDFAGYVWADGVTTEEVEVTNTKGEKVKQTQVDIAAAAAGLLNNTINSLGEDPKGTVDESGTYTATIYAGAYIAIISGGGDTIYNPVLLTATYGATTDLDGGNIVLTPSTTYLYGTTAVAKMSKPDIKKEVTNDTNKDNADDDKTTATVGDTLSYTITPTMPSYPLNATNKTVYVTDNMSEGLTFNYDSLSVKIGEETAAKNKTTVGEVEVTSFSVGGKAVAKAIKVDNGFRLVFDYEQLVSDQTMGATTQPVVTYNATLNDNAVVGGDGTGNTATLKYTTNPYDGNTYKDPEKEEPKDNVGTKETTETVYSYQLAFMKVDPGKDLNDTKDDTGLAGATFGIYSDKDAKILVDTVVTDKNGYAVSTKVAKGTYYIKEIAAPEGYSLNETVYKAEVSYAAAKTEVSKKTTYTSEKPSEDSVQVGYLLDDVFKTYAEYEKLSEEEKAQAKAAYVASEQITVTEDKGDGAGTLMLSERIPNTKLSSLPSTGGIGTTIFTLGGCAIMILAAALYFATRRKSAR